MALWGDGQRGQMLMVKPARLLCSLKSFALTFVSFFVLLLFESGGSRSLLRFSRPAPLPCLASRKFQTRETRQVGGGGIRARRRGSSWWELGCVKTHFLCSYFHFFQKEIFPISL